MSSPAGPASPSPTSGVANVHKPGAVKVVRKPASRKPGRTPGRGGK